MPSVIPGVHIKRTGWGLFVRVLWLTVLCLILAGTATAVGGAFWVFLFIFWLPGIALALMLQGARLTTASLLVNRSELDSWLAMLQDWLEAADEPPLD